MTEGRRQVEEDFLSTDAIKTCMVQNELRVNRKEAYDQTVSCARLTELSICSLAESTYYL